MTAQCGAAEPPDYAALFFIGRCIAVDSNEQEKLKLLETIKDNLKPGALRMILAPALMRLAGDWNWWAPAWLLRTCRHVHPRMLALGKQLLVAAPQVRAVWLVTRGRAYFQTGGVYSQFAQ